MSQIIFSCPFMSQIIFFLHVESQNIFFAQCEGKIIFFGMLIFYLTLLCFIPETCVLNIHVCTQIHIHFHCVPGIGGHSYCPPIPCTQWKCMWQAYWGSWWKSYYHNHCYQWYYYCCAPWLYMYVLQTLVLLTVWFCLQWKCMCQAYWGSWWKLS